MQTRTKLEQALKGVFNCCKLEIAFNDKKGFPILSVTKILYPKTLYLVLLINFSVLSAEIPMMPNFFFFFFFNWDSLHAGLNSQ